MDAKKAATIRKQVVKEIVRALRQDRRRLLYRACMGTGDMPLLETEIPKDETKWAGEVFGACVKALKSLDQKGKATGSAYDGRR